MSRHLTSVISEDLPREPGGCCDCPFDDRGNRVTRTESPGRRPCSWRTEDNLQNKGECRPRGCPDPRGIGGPGPLTAGGSWRSQRGRGFGGRRGSGTLSRDPCEAGEGEETRPPLPKPLFHPGGDGGFSHAGPAPGLPCGLSSPDTSVGPCEIQPRARATVEADPIVPSSLRPLRSREPLSSRFCCRMGSSPPSQSHPSPAGPASHPQTRSEPARSARPSRKGGGPQLQLSLSTSGSHPNPGHQTDPCCGHSPRVGPGGLGAHPSHLL